MAEIVAVISFGGLDRDGVINVGPLVKAGDKVAGICNITSGSGSLPEIFGTYAPADEHIVQISGGNWSTSRFVATITRD